ncbi:hypothetical protein BDN72DRAFT_774190, partial [Pluteus cervinus]
MSETLNATHSRWRDGVTSHQIIDVRHVPGKINVVADGLSRAMEGVAKEGGDGSEWTVSEDWETGHGLVHDLFAVSPHSRTLTTEEEALRIRFESEPVFTEVLGAIWELDHGVSPKKRARARHRATEYLVDEGKLWRLRGGSSTRARSRVECITKEEARKEAENEHKDRGHWGRDAIKKHLMDRIWCPKLDDAILYAI